MLFLTLLPAFLQIARTEENRGSALSRVPVMANAQGKHRFAREWSPKLSDDTLHVSQGIGEFHRDANASSHGEPKQVREWPFVRADSWHTYTYLCSMCCISTRDTFPFPVSQGTTSHHARSARRKPRGLSCQVTCPLDICLPGKTFESELITPSRMSLPVPFTCVCACGRESLLTRNTSLSVSNVNTTRSRQDPTLEAANNVHLRPIAGRSNFNCEREAAHPYRPS